MGIMKKISLSGLFVIIVGLMVASNASAVTLLDQPPDQLSGYFADRAYGSFAENFTLVDTNVVNQIVLWGFYGSNTTPPAVDNFTVNIHQDDAGLPGTAVYSQSGIVPIERTSAGFSDPYWGGVVYMFTLNLPTPPTLPAGTYWAEIYGDTIDAVEDNDFLWATGILDTTNGILGSADSSEVPGITWYPQIDPAIDLALQINSIPQTQPASIPTLSEWGYIVFILLLGAVGVVALRRPKIKA